MVKKEHRIALHSAENQRSLVEQGYFTTPLLTASEVKACSDFYHKTKSYSVGLKYNTLEVNSYNHRKQVAIELRSIIGPRILAFLNNYKFIGINLAVKEAFAPPFASHIDDTHVDESEWPAINVWIPLVDVDETNGSLYVVPRSHLLPAGIRGIGLPFSYAEYEPEIQARQVSLNLKAGEAVFFDDKLIHGSPANKTTQSRPAIIASLIQSEAQPIVYMSYDKLDPHEAEKFHAPEEFYWWVQIGKRPENFESLGFYQQQPMVLSKEEFTALLDSK